MKHGPIVYQQAYHPVTSKLWQESKQAGQFWGRGYPAPGDPGTAERISRDSSDPSIHPGNELWGLDHGTWPVLRHMHPAADVPVLQLSPNQIQGPEFHFAVGEKLKYLRREGPEHWYPHLHTLGAGDDGEPLRFEHEGIENASISMRCLSLGA